MSLFRNWKVQHQQYFDRPPCRHWPELWFDFRKSSYGANVPFIVTSILSVHTVNMNIRLLRRMPARNIDIGELRVMSGDPEVLRLIGKYHTWIVAHNRLVIVNEFANITCIEVP